ncbi:hypothetical protein [Paenibacillus silviterrae]|uniref:hypothetical protein n=1 Tax=Paenibacillus silviterrae TaxID=3242194 RepID=UPI00254362C1|nr:hypothetical protein [Paenibacillus chinjuensis]
MSNEQQFQELNEADASIRNDVPNVNVNTGSGSKEKTVVNAKENTHLDNSHISVNQE